MNKPTKKKKKKLTTNKKKKKKKKGGDTFAEFFFFFEKLSALLGFALSTASPLSLSFFFFIDWKRQDKEWSCRSTFGLHFFFKGKEKKKSKVFHYFTMERGRDEHKSKKKINK